MNAPTPEALYELSVKAIAGDAQALRELTDDVEGKAGWRPPASAILARAKDYVAAFRDTFDS